MQSEREQDGAMDPQRAARIARNRQALRAVEENERSARKKAPGWQEERFADERSTA
jgi:hypothetical protein